MINKFIYLMFGVFIFITWHTLDPIVSESMPFWVTVLFLVSMASSVAYYAAMIIIGDEEDD